MFHQVTGAKAEMDRPDADSKTARARLLPRKGNTLLADKGAFSPCLRNKRRKSGMFKCT